MLQKTRTLLHRPLQYRSFSCTVYSAYARKPLPPPRSVEKEAIERAERGIFKVRQEGEEEDIEPRKLPKATIVPNKRTDINAILSGDANCPGCGAHFQTKDVEKEGFIRPDAIETFVQEEAIFDRVSKLLQQRKHVKEPSEAPIVDMHDLKIYEKIKYQQRSLVCMRCHSLTHYNESRQQTKPQISAQDFLDKLKQLRDMKNILIVKIVDLLNPENSFIPRFAEMVGDKHPVILVGNKIDLLPANAAYSRLTQWLRQQWNKFVLHEKAQDVNLKSVILVSSKSGINMNRLAERIEEFRDGRDVYVVGTTNVGKSTLINKLIHVVSGTYEKDFANPKHYKKVIPMQTAEEEPVESVEEEEVEPEIVKKDEWRPPSLTTSMMPGTTLKTISFLVKGQSKERAYLYDTPGIWNKALPANYVFPQEYKYLQPVKRMKPRHIRLRPGKSVFIGGLARIDYESNDLENEHKNVLTLTLFSSHVLPVHATKIENADRIYQQHLGKMIYPPFNMTDHPELAPLDKKKTFIYHGHSRLKSVADIVISGVGWLSVTGIGKITISVHAPKVLVVHSRDNPLMPFETYKLRKEDVEIDAI